MYYYSRFRLLLFRSPLLQESSFLSFPVTTQMFQFITFPSICYFTYILIDQLFSQSEFPHSDICDSMDICSYSQLFAAYHVLHRLLVPRHSPYALCSLTFKILKNLFFNFLVLFFISTVFSIFLRSSFCFSTLLTFRIAFQFFQFTLFLIYLYIFQCAVQKLDVRCEKLVFIPFH